MKVQTVDLIFASQDDAMEANEIILGFETQPQDITNNGEELRLIFESLSAGYDWFDDNYKGLLRVPYYHSKWADNEQDTGHATIAERNGWS